MLRCLPCARHISTRLSCRRHPGPSSEEPGRTVEDAVRMRGAEHGAPGPQHLYPSVPEKHRTADRRHLKESHPLPDQRWAARSVIKMLRLEEELRESRRMNVTVILILMCVTRPGYQRQLNYKHSGGSFSTFGIGIGNTWWEAQSVTLLRSHRQDLWANVNLFTGWPPLWWDLLPKQSRSSTSTRCRTPRSGFCKNRKRTAVLSSMESSSTTEWRWSDKPSLTSRPWMWEMLMVWMVLPLLRAAFLMKWRSALISQLPSWRWTCRLL